MQSFAKSEASNSSNEPFESERVDPKQEQLGMEKALEPGKQEKWQDDIIEALAVTLTHDDDATDISTADHFNKF